MACTYRYARLERPQTGRGDKFSFRVDQSIPNFVLRMRRREERMRKGEEEDFAVRSSSYIALLAVMVLQT
jgi:hypothetical protein